MCNFQCHIFLFFLRDSDINIQSSTPNQLHRTCYDYVKLSMGYRRLKFKNYNRIYSVREKRRVSLLDTIYYWPLHRLTSFHESQNLN